MLIAENNELWVRHDRQKSQMTLAELRVTVNSTEDLEMKLERYIEQRRARLGPQAGSRLLLAITATPLSIESGGIDVNGAEVKHVLETVDTRVNRSFLLTGGRTGVPTLEGRLVELWPVTLEIFRTGGVELVMRDPSRLVWPKDSMPAHFADRPDTVLIGLSIVELLFRVVDLARRLAEVSSITDPYAFTVDMWNCGGFSFGSGNGRAEPTLFAGPVMVSQDETMDSALRRIADLVWNGFGVEKCPHFDADGKLNLPNS